MGFVRSLPQRLHFGSTADQSDQFSHTVRLRISPTQLTKRTRRPERVFDCRIDTKLLKDRKIERRRALSDRLHLRGYGGCQN